MKKIYSFIATAALALAFTACEDVPAPYGINAGGNGGGTVDPKPDGVIIDESFSSSLGKFTTATPVGNYPWAISYGSAQVTSFVDTDGDGQKENVPAESWLISPKMNLSATEAANVSFDYILRYGNSNQLKSHYQLLVSADYDNDVATATWTPLEYNQVQGTDWDTWYTSGKVNIPAEFCGKENVTVALCYKATNKSATWEVKNFKVMSGAGEENPGGNPGGDDDTEKTLPYSEAFGTTLGAFKNYTTSGAGEWTIDFSTAKATGYDNASQTTTAGTYYLVSPKISLAGQTDAHVSYEYILRYDRGQENQQVYISDSFDPANPAAGWTLLNGAHTEGTDWATFSKADIQIPAEYMGKTVRLAFRYNTNAESGSTWEVKNFAIASGKVGESGGETGGDEMGEPGTNGGFEEWASDTQPVNWKSASTAGNAKLSKSTDAHSGSFSVCVENGTTQNKRIAYREMEVKAGTYTISFYAKAATAEGGSLAAGYVPVDESGKVGSYLYDPAGSTKPEYVNDLSNTEWVLVERTYTIAQDSKVCFVIMNAKNPGKSILIDDFTVKNAAGEYIIR